MNTDRLITDWLQSAAPARAPRILLDTTLERVSAIPQDRAKVRVVRGRRADPRLLLVAAVVSGTALVGSVLLAGGGPGPHPSPAAPGPDWIAVVTAKANAAGSNISLVRPGLPPHAIAGGDEVGQTELACPSFSGDGTQLAYGRASLAGGSNPVNAAVVIQHVAADGTLAGEPWSYPVTDAAGGSDGFAPPCAVWAPARPLFAFVNATPDPTAPVGPTGTVITVGTLSGGRLTTRLDANVIDLSWSPQGDQLAVSTTNGIELLSTVERRPQLLAGTQGAGWLDWSPDGERIAYQRPVAAGSDAVDLVVRDLGTEQDSVVASFLNNHGIGPLWSRAGDALLYQRVCRGCREQHEVVVLTLRPGRSTWTADAVAERVLATPLIDGFRWYPFWTTWSPDGSAVLEAAWSSGSGPETDGLVVVPVAGDAQPQMVVQSQAVAGVSGIGAGVPGVSPTTWANVP